MLDEHAKGDGAPMPDEQNGVTFQWVAGALVAIVMSGGAFWLNYVAAQVDDLRYEQKIESKENSQVRERLRGVEIKVEGIDDTTKQTATDVRQIRESLEQARGSWGLSPRSRTLP